MRIYPLLLSLLATLWLSGCSNAPINNDGLLAKNIYELGHNALLRKSYLEAIEHFDDLQVQYPFGEYAQQGELEKAYAHFKSNEFSATEETLKHFIRVYPRHPHIEYAYYLRALSSYTQGVGYRGKIFKVNKTSRNAAYAQRAFQYFATLIKRFPDSRYREDSVVRMRTLRNHLAAHELHIANYYFKRKAYVAAVNRAKNILQTYPEAAQIPATLTLMVRCYRAMNMETLADDSQRVLELNFPEASLSDNASS